MRWLSVGDWSNSNHMSWNAYVLLYFSLWFQTHALNGKEMMPRAHVFEMMGKILAKAAEVK